MSFIPARNFFQAIFGGVTPAQLDAALQDIQSNGLSPESQQKLDAALVDADLDTIRDALAARLTKATGDETYAAVEVIAALQNRIEVLETGSELPVITANTLPSLGPIDDQTVPASAFTGGSYLVDGVPVDAGNITTQFLFDGIVEDGSALRAGGIAVIGRQIVAVNGVSRTFDTVAVLVTQTASSLDLSALTLTRTLVPGPLASFSVGERGDDIVFRFPSVPFPSLAADEILFELGWTGEGIVIYRTADGNLIVRAGDGDEDPTENTARILIPAPVGISIDITLEINMTAGAIRLWTGDTLRDTFYTASGFIGSSEGWSGNNDGGYGTTDGNTAGVGTRVLSAWNGTLSDLEVYAGQIVSQIELPLKVITAGTVAPAQPKVGDTLSFTAPVLSGTPEAFTGPIVTLDGVEINHLQPLAEPGALSVTWTASNALTPNLVTNPITRTVTAPAMASNGVRFGAGDVLISGAAAEPIDTFIMAAQVEVPTYDGFKMLFSKGFLDMKLRREGTRLRLEHNREGQSGTLSLGSAVQANEPICVLLTSDGIRLRGAMLDSTGVTTAVQNGAVMGLPATATSAMRFGQHQNDPHDANGVIFHSWRLWANMAAGGVPDPLDPAVQAEFFDLATREPKPLGPLLTTYGDETTNLLATLDGDIANYVDTQLLGNNLGRVPFTMNGQPVAIDGTGDPAPAPDLGPNPNDVAPDVSTLTVNRTHNVGTFTAYSDTERNQSVVFKALAVPFPTTPGNYTLARMGSGREGMALFALDDGTFEAQFGLRPSEGLYDNSLARVAVPMPLGGTHDVTWEYDAAVRSIRLWIDNEMVGVGYAHLEIGDYDEQRWSTGLGGAWGRKGNMPSPRFKTFSDWPGTLPVLNVYLNQRISPVVVSPWMREKASFSVGRGFIGSRIDILPPVILGGGTITTELTSLTLADVDVLPDVLTETGTQYLTPAGTGPLRATWTSSSAAGTIDVTEEISVFASGSTTADWLSLSGHRTELVQGEGLYISVEGLTEKEAGTWGFRFDLDDVGQTRPLMVGMPDKFQDENAPIGYLAAHAWRTPGLKTVTCKVMPPAWTGLPSATLTMDVQVQSRTDFFPESKRFVVDPTGNFSGLPATVPSTNRFTSLSAANNAMGSQNGGLLYMRNGKSYLFGTTNFGKSFDTSNGRQSNHFQYVGFGSGAKAIVDVANGSFGHSKGPDNSPLSIAFHGIDFMGDYNPATGRSASGLTSRKTGISSNTNSHLTLLDCVFRGCQSGISLTGGTGGSMIAIDSHFRDWENFGIFIAACDHVAIVGCLGLQNPNTVAGVGKTLSDALNWADHGFCRISEVFNLIMTYTRTHVINGWTGSNTSQVSLLFTDYTPYPQPALRLASNHIVEKGSKILLGQNYLEGNGLDTFGGGDGGYGSRSRIVIQGNYGLNNALGGGDAFGHSGIWYTNNIQVVPNVKNVNGQLDAGLSMSPGKPGGNSGRKIAWDTASNHVGSNTVAYMKSTANEGFQADQLSRGRLDASDRLEAYEQAWGIEYTSEGWLIWVPNQTVTGETGPIVPAGGMTGAVWGPPPLYNGFRAAQNDGSIVVRLDFATPANSAILPVPGGNPTHAADNTNALDFLGVYRPATPTLGAIEKAPLADPIDPTTLTISGPQAGEYRSNGEAFDRYAATGATWQVDHTAGIANDYPFYINGSQQPLVEVFGGTTLGSMTATTPRLSVYPGFNSAGLFVFDVPAHIHDWTFGEAGIRDGGMIDAIRLRGNYEGSIIERVQFYAVRDDLFELDDSASSLTIRDCFAEDSFTGISATGAVTGKLITVKNTIMHFGLYPDADASDITHGHPFKVDEGAGPDWHLEDTVIAITDPNYPGWNRTAEAFSKMTGARNELLVLGASLAVGHPALHSSFTLYEGQAAIDRYAAKKAAFFG